MNTLKCWLPAETLLFRVFRKNVVIIMGKMLRTRLPTLREVSGLSAAVWSVQLESQASQAALLGLGDRVNPNYLVIFKFLF